MSQDLQTRRQVSRTCMAALRAKRRAEGRCIDCGEKAAQGRARCVADLERQARKNRERRQG